MELNMAKQQLDYLPGTRVSCPGRGKVVETGTLVSAETWVIKWDKDGCEEEWGTLSSFEANGGKILQDLRCSYSELIGFKNDLNDLLAYHGARLMEDGVGFTIGEEGFEQDILWEKLADIVKIYFEHGRS
jgi:hypothetical protein